MSKLASFKYLRSRRIIALTLILALASTLFSVTALSFLSFYNGFNSYLGENENIIAIYDKQSNTPFTGIIPAYLTDKINEVDGVITTSPEVIAPSIINGKTLFIRGIIPQQFFKLTPTSITQGTILDNNPNAIILGKNIAQKLNLNINDKILVFSALSDRYIELQITGIYTTDSTLDDEALVLLNAGQWLRAIGYNSVTLIRVEINKQIVTPEQIYQEIAQKADTTPPTTSPKTNFPAILPWITTKFNLESLEVGNPQNLMKSYLDRYGITQESIIILSIMVFLFSSITIIFASQTFILQHKTDIDILKAIGASNNTLKIDLIQKLLPIALIASSLGLLITAITLTMLQAHGYLQVLSHNIHFTINPIILILNFILILTLVSISIIRSDLK
jgi:ABC-type lipoprotein release transport system permease subunit